MAFNLRNRSFIKEIDFEPDQLRYLLRLAQALKLAKYAGNETTWLAGKEIALIFEQTSTRTRSAFEVAAYDQGAHVTYLGPPRSRLGQKESVADTAGVLGRMFDAIEYRGSRQADVETLAAHAGVPVYNGQTDDWHPTQMLADFLTMYEASHKHYHDIAYAFVGDCRLNMARSLLVMGALMGSDVRLTGPSELLPPKDVVEHAADIAARTGARVTITDNLAAAVSGVDFVHTDVWVSKGETKDVWTERVELLAPYQVNADLLAKTGNPSVRFMHRLPAFHDTSTAVGREIMEHTDMTAGLEVAQVGMAAPAAPRRRLAAPRPHRSTVQYADAGAAPRCIHLDHGGHPPTYLRDLLEVTGEVFDSPASIVFDQAENRLHTIKAILVATLG